MLTNENNLSFHVNVPQEVDNLAAKLDNIKLSPKSSDNNLLKSEWLKVKDSLESLTGSQPNKVITYHHFLDQGGNLKLVLLLYLLVEGRQEKVVIDVLSLIIVKMT